MLKPYVIANARFIINDRQLSVSSQCLQLQHLIFHESKILNHIKLCKNVRQKFSFVIILHFCIKTKIFATQENTSLVATDLQCGRFIMRLNIHINKTSILESRYRQGEPGFLRQRIFFLHPINNGDEKANVVDDIVRSDYDL